MIEYSIYIHFFLIYILCIGLLFLIGGLTKHFLNFNIRSATFSSLFFNLFLGVVTFNLIYGAVNTGFRSVQMLFILPLIFILYESRKFKGWDQNPILKKDFVVPVKTIALVTLFFAGLIFSIEYLKVITNSPFPYIIQNQDYNLYSNISYFVKSTGQENSFQILNTLHPDYTGSKPYHYFESWLNAGISSTFGGLNILHFTLNTWPIFYFTCFIGIVSAIEIHKGKTDIKDYLLAFLLMFLGGMYFNFYKVLPFLGSIDTLSLSPLRGLPKVIYYYIFGLAGVICISKKNYITGIIFLLSLQIATITSVFAISGAVVGLLLMNIRFKFLEPSKVKRILIYTFIIDGSIILFYALFDNGKINMEGTSNNGLVTLLLSDAFNLYSFKTRFNIVAGSFIQVAITHFILFAAIFLLRKPIYKIIADRKEVLLLFVFTFVMFISGVGAWAVFYGLFNGVQLFSNPCISLLNTFLIFLIVTILYSSMQRSYKNIFLGATVFVCTMNIIFAVSLGHRFATNKRFSDGYLLQIKDYFEDKKAVNGGSFLDVDAYKGTYTKYNIHYTLGDYLVFIKDGLAPISLSDFEAKIDTTLQLNRERETSALEMGIFYRHVKEQQQNKTFVSIAQSQLQFIEKYKLRYLIFSKDAKIPETIEHLIGDTIIDPLSGERFVILI